MPITKNVFATLVIVFCFSFAPGNCQAPMQGMQGGRAATIVNRAQGQKGAKPPKTDKKLIKQWFKRYDVVRRKAQLNPKAKAEANKLLAKGLAIIIPGEEKKATRKLLTDLVTRYGSAVDEIKLLPLYPETEALHRGYYQYFSQVKGLFSDYLVVQNNVLATDASGNPLARTLMFRKQNLEQLDLQNKAIDNRLRQTFGIKAYSYKGSN